MKKKLFAMLLTIMLLFEVFSLTSCSINKSVYTRVNSGGAQSNRGDYILLGSYPQTEVTDQEIKSALSDCMEGLPSSNNEKWKSYEYYVSSEVSDYMWYIDVELGDEAYRGVYFTEYRPWKPELDSSTKYSLQDNNGYETGTVYWFRYEPIKWKIIRKKWGEALLLCDMIIDAQAYQNSYIKYGIGHYAADDDGNIQTNEEGYNVKASNYAYSSIRAWLNDDFYNTAFSDIDKRIIQCNKVDNSAATMERSDLNGNVECENTIDNMFLLSYKDAKKAKRKGHKLNAREATDYACCQGAQTDIWRLRTPSGYYYSRFSSSNHSEYAMAVNSIGNYSSDTYVFDVTIGVCPAMWIRL